MLAFLLAVSLAMQATVAPGNPVGARWDNLLSALIDAHVAVERLGHCTTELPARRDLEADYQALLHRSATAFYAAQALNPDVDPTSEATVRLMAAGAPRCTASSLQSYLTEARRSLAVAEAELRSDPVMPSRGLWLGGLHLCGARVIAVETGEPEFPGQTGLVLHFSRDFAAQVRALTAQRVGSPLSVVLDGSVIMSPIVREPVGEVISISGPDGLPTDRIRAAVAAPC